MERAAWLVLRHCERMEVARGGEQAAWGTQPECHNVLADAGRTLTTLVQTLLGEERRGYCEGQSAEQGHPGPELGIGPLRPAGSHAALGTCPFLSPLPGSV